MDVLVEGMEGLMEWMEWNEGMEWNGLEGMKPSPRGKEGRME